MDIKPGKSSSIMKTELKRIDEYVPQYWEGRKNILIRYYIYALKGLGQVNEFKYLAAGILATYYTLKFTNPIWMLWIFSISIPVLIIIGRWQLHKVSKVTEWVNTQFGSVNGYNGYNMQIEQIELLEKILEQLKNK